MRLLLPLLGCVAIVSHAAEPIRVACLGDSITAGAKVKAATESYPAQLQQMLGANYVVKNFGAGGATLWHGGKPNAFEQLAGASAFAPQIAIVMFGINDTRSRDVNYWGHFAEFEADAMKLLDTLLRLPTKPHILLCPPTANFADLPGMPDERKANVAERLPRLVQVRAKIAEIAKRYAARGSSWWIFTRPPKSVRKSSMWMACISKPRATNSSPNRCARIWKRPLGKRPPRRINECATLRFADPQINLVDEGYPLLDSRR